MKSQICVLLLIFSAIVSSQAQKVISIKKVKSAPKIDGIVDESWKMYDSQSVAEGRNNFKGISGDFKMCYDSQFLYVLVTVFDKTPNKEQANKNWQSDNVELYFAMDTSNSETYRIGDCELRKVNAKPQMNGGMDVKATVPEIILMSKDFVVAQKDHQNTMVQEWKIPLDALKKDSKFDGKHFRFELQLCDNDGTGRVGQLFWNSNADDQWTKIKSHGMAKLE